MKAGTLVFAGLTTILAACATVQPTVAADHIRAPYRALGTEPFWSLRVESDTILFEEANAPGVVISQPVTQRSSGPDGSTYFGSARLKIWSKPARCSDGMSDRIFPLDVIVQVDERRFEGCGGDPISGPEAP